MSGSGPGPETGCSMSLNMGMGLRGGIGGAVFIRGCLLRRFKAEGIMDSNDG